VFSSSDAASARTDQVGMVDRSDRSHWDGPTRIQRTPVRGASHQGRRALGCSRVGRPPRTSSNAVEIQEEQQTGVGKARVWIR
jgi:hypothetical protein